MVSLQGVTSIQRLQGPMPYSKASTSYTNNTSNINTISAPLYAGQMLHGAYFNRSLMPSNIKFGSCVCPVCASMALMVEAHNRVKQLQAGDEIKPGALLSQITNKTGYNYIPHANATRISLPAADDVDALQKAALDKKPNGNGYKIEMPTQGSLYSEVSGALANGQKQANYMPHPNNIDYSPHYSVDFLNKLKNLQNGDTELFSIIHHMQNDTEKVTKPISKGFVLASQIKNGPKNELALLSLRALPEREGMDIPAAGLANVLTNLATDPKAHYQSIAVTVEADQQDLKRYLGYLNDLGLGVKRYAVMGNGQKPNGFQLTEMPHSYQATLSKLYANPPSMFNVDIAPIYEWMQSGIPETVKKAAFQYNPDLKADLEKVKKSSNKQTIALDSLMTLFAPPPAPGARARKTLPRD